MIKPRNEDIRKAKGKIPFYLIAERLGIHDQTLYSWMRRELPEDKKEQIFAIIQDLKEEMQPAN